MQNKNKRIYKRWKRKAKEFGVSHKATIRDLYFRKLNTYVVLKYIRRDYRLLDVGCGNGYATAEYAKKAKFTLGVDYLPEFIELANKRYKKQIKSKRLAFQLLDINDLRKLSVGSFDAITCERVIINLPTWGAQKRAVRDIWRLLKPGGKLLLTEITKQGHRSLGELRRRLGLPPVEKYWSNLYLDEPKFDRYLRKYFRIEKKIRFGTYGLISKLLYPLLIAPREPKFLAKINKAAFEVSKTFIGETGPSHTVFYVLKKTERKIAKKI